MRRMWMFLLLLALCALPCLAAEPVVTAQGLPIEKLTLLAPRDKGFESALAAILQGKHDLLIESVKDMGVILRNDSDRSVVTFTVRFHSEPAGPSMPPGWGYGAVEDLLDGGQPKPESRYFKRRVWVIPPGGSRFITRGLTLGKEDAVNDAAQRGTAALLRVQARLDRTRAQWQDHRVTFILESALFDDGEVVGPDAAYEAKSIREELDGYQAVFSEVVHSASSGTQPAAVMKAIAEVAEQKPRPEDFTPAGWRRFYAERLLMIAGQSGDQAAIEYAAQRLFRNPPDIHVGKLWPKETAKTASR